MKNNSWLILTFGFLAGFTITSIAFILFHPKPEFAIYVKCPPATGDNGKPRICAEIHTRLDVWQSEPHIFKIWPEVTLNGGKVTGFIIDEYTSKIMSEALSGKSAKKEDE